MQSEIWCGGEEEYGGNSFPWKSVVVHVLANKRCGPDQQLQML